MPIAGLTPASFDLPGTLIESGSRRRHRAAPLGILLNRMKRMPHDKRAKARIQYGSIVFNPNEIDELLNSEEFATWLRAPSVPFRW